MKEVPFSVYLLYGFEICVTWQCKSSWKTNPLLNLTAQRYPPPPWRIFLVHFESQCALAILRIERLLDPKGTISIWGWEPCCRVVVALHLQQGHAVPVPTVHVVLCVSRMRPRPPYEKLSPLAAAWRVARHPVILFAQPDDEDDFFVSSSYWTTIFCCGDFHSIFLRMREPLAGSLAFFQFGWRGKGPLKIHPVCVVCMCYLL